MCPLKKKFTSKSLCNTACHCLSPGSVWGWGCWPRLTTQCVCLTTAVTVSWGLVVWQQDQPVLCPASWSLSGTNSKIHTGTGHEFLFNYCTRWGVGIKRYAPAALTRKKTRYTFCSGLGEHLSRSGRLRKNPATVGFDPRTVARRESPQPTTLSRPTCVEYTNLNI